MCRHPLCRVPGEKPYEQDHQRIYKLAFAGRKEDYGVLVHDLLEATCLTVIDPSVVINTHTYDIGTTELRSSGTVRVSHPSQRDGSTTSGVKLLLLNRRQNSTETQTSESNKPVTCDKNLAMQETSTKTAALVVVFIASEEASFTYTSAAQFVFMLCHRIGQLLQHFAVVICHRVC